MTNGLKDNGSSGSESSKGLLKRISRGDYDAPRDSELKKCDPQALQKAIRKGMLKLLRGGHIPGFYVTYATEETKRDSELQTALQRAIVHKAASGGIMPDEFTLLATDETKQNSQVQDALRRGISLWTNINQQELDACRRNFLAAIDVLPRVKNESSPLTRATSRPVSEWVLHEDSLALRTYLPLVTAETMRRSDIQSNLARMIGWWTRNGLNIPQIIAHMATRETIQGSEVQEMLLRGIVTLTSKGLPVWDRYLQLTTEETQRNPEIQVALCAGADKFVDNKYDLSDPYFTIATDETKRSPEIQTAIKEIIARRVENNEDIPDEYLALATDETVALIHDQYQSAVKYSIQRFVTRGLSFWNLMRAATKETRESIRQESFMREAMKNVIAQFFGNKEELAEPISQKVGGMSKKELEKVLFTLDMPVGIKIHLKQASPHIAALQPFFEKTGGFAKGGHETCYVTPPTHNRETLKICLEVLEKKVGPLFSAEGSESLVTVQVCLPHRLDNELCGVATVAFLLGSPYTKAFTSEDLKTNRNTGNFLTIYDAAGAQEDRLAVPMKSPANATPIHVRGRTDIILCQSREDIENAHLILALLVAASHPAPIAFKETGQRFVRELSKILGKHRVSHWLAGKFVGSKPSEREQEQFERMLLELTEHKRKDAVLVRRINRDIERHGHQLDELQRMRFNRLLTVKVQDLIARYRTELYNETLGRSLE